MWFINTEEFVNHEAGLDGRGGSSYIDLVACVNEDLSSAWTSASDGVLETRRYYCQNWHADVVALISSSGWMLEQDRYSAYGAPFGLPGGDTNSDGDCDSSDSSQIQTWINGSVYDIRGDVDLDGDVDATDKSRVDSAYVGVTLGWTVLSNFGNRRGYAGYEQLGHLGIEYSIRNRTLAVDHGRWLTRDPANEYEHGGLYEYCRSAPLVRSDADGTLSSPNLPQDVIVPKSPPHEPNYEDPNFYDLPPRCKMKATTYPNPGNPDDPNQKHIIVSYRCPGKCGMGYYEVNQVAGCCTGPKAQESVTSDCALAKCKKALKNFGILSSTTGGNPHFPSEFHENCYNFCKRADCDYMVKKFDKPCAASVGIDPENDDNYKVCFYGSLGQACHCKLKDPSPPH